MTKPNGTATTATVEVLTAEVRVLMVGSRQVTLSVARQLDRVDLSDVAEVFGRVRPERNDPAQSLIGRHRDTGALVIVPYPPLPPPVREGWIVNEDHVAQRQWRTETLPAWEHAIGHLPLIVLAGLR